MRLSKTEWMGVAVIAGSIACFGGWLQSEMQRAALARIHRNTPDPLAACGDVSVRDAEMLGKGELWCGTIGTEHVVTAQAAPSVSVNDANSALRRTAVQTQ